MGSNTAEAAASEIQESTEEKGLPWIIMIMQCISSMKHLRGHLLDLIQTHLRGHLLDLKPKKGSWKLPTIMFND